MKKNTKNINKQVKELEELIRFYGIDKMKK